MSTKGLMTKERWERIKRGPDSKGSGIGYQPTTNMYRMERDLFGISHRQQKRERMKALRENAP